MSGKMRVTMLPLRDLQPAKYNPREISEESLDRLVELLRLHGCVEPVVVNGANGNTIVGGHQRFKAAKRLKWKEMPCVILDLTDEQEKKLNIALNNPAAQGRYDPEKLSALLASLEAGSLDLNASMGFSDEEYERIVNWKPGADLDFFSFAAGGGDDEISKPSDAELLLKLGVTITDPETETNRGEVWRVGNHLLVLADVVDEVAIWLPHLKPDMLFCPYPGVYITLTNRAEKNRILMVQPEPYIASSIIDAHRAIHGGDDIKRLITPPEAK